jgi:oligosaccharide repeat unit polymerase
MYIFSGIALAIIMLTVALFSARQFRDLYNPVSVMGFTWMIAILYMLLNPEFPLISTAPVLYILTTFAAFSIGVNLAFIINSKRVYVYKFRFSDLSLNLNSKRVLITYYLLLCVLVIGFYIYIQPYVAILLEYNSLSYYIEDIRRELVHDNITIEISYQVLVQMPMILNIFSLFLFSHYMKTKSNSVLFIFIVILIMAFIASNIAGSRSLFIRYFVALLILFMINTKRKKVILRSFLPILLLITVFVLVGAMRDNSINFIDSIFFTLGTLLKYIFLPMVVFSYRYPNLEEVYSSDIFTYGWLNNIIGQPQNPQYVETTFISGAYSLQSNAYTYLGGMVNDFGIYKSVLVIMFIGLIIGIVYLKSQKNIMYNVMYSLMLSSTVFSLYSEKFISMAPHFMRIFIIYLIIKFIFKKRFL